jgi:hypothetical protein
MTIVVLVILMVMQPFAGAQQFTPAAKPAVAGKAASRPTQDIGWPRQVAKNGATLVYYQPQIDDWSDYKQLTGRVAFSLTPAGGKQTFGVASFLAGTLVDRDTRTAFFRDIQINDVRFPSLDDAAAMPMEQLLRQLVPTGGEPISVDRLMADLEHGKVSAQAVPVKNDPPLIFYSTSPAILLIVEGDPVLAPIENLDLQFIVNTNWNVLFDKSKKEYYLLDETRLLTAKDLKGPWTQSQTVPKDMVKLPDSGNWIDVKKAALAPRPEGDAPTVFFSSVPAELVLLKGYPVYAKIAGTRLLYATNTESDLFVNDADRQFYLLLSGRWFRSKTLDGPWSYASDNLPSDFSKIPSNSPKARVLASMPGTVEAADAVMLAQIPTTAILSKTDAEAEANATYDGDPQFNPIEGTSMQYAANTQDKVIKVGDLYYMCFQAVWFMSSKPAGPWKVADSVPKEIYTIPPSSPVYNVTYVTQTTTPTTVESSSTAGYLGMFVVSAAVGTAIAFGTGYYYPPYVYWGPGMGYPIYRPWPATYGAAAVYNPWTGGFAVGHTAYGPYAAAGSAGWYNPATGRYGQAASVQGWYGARTVASFYNPWTGTYGATSQGHSAYAQWGTSAAVRGDQWVQTGHVTRDEIANGTIAKGSNYTYAGDDGNVYRKDSRGNWSTYGDSEWKSVDASGAKQQALKVQNAKPQGGFELTSSRPAVQSDTMQALNSSAQSRQRGRIQTQRFQSFQAGGGRFRR